MNDPWFDIFAHGMHDPRSAEAQRAADVQGLNLVADIEKIGAKAVEVFTCGECHALAAALSHLLYAPCVIATVRYHVGVRLGDWMLDIHGLTKVEAWERRWAEVEPQTGQVERNWRLKHYDTAGEMLEACDCGTPDLDVAGVYAQLVCEQLGIDAPGLELAA